MFCSCVCHGVLSFWTWILVLWLTLEQKQCGLWGIWSPGSPHSKWTLIPASHHPRPRPRPRPDSCVFRGGLQIQHWVIWTHQVLLEPATGAATLWKRSFIMLFKINHKTNVWFWMGWFISGCQWMCERIFLCKSFITNKNVVVNIIVGLWELIWDQIFLMNVKYKPNTVMRTSEWSFSGNVCVWLE